MKRLTKCLVGVLILEVTAFATVFTLNAVTFKVSTFENSLEQKEELFSDYYSRAREFLDHMTIDEKIGQLLFARVPEVGAKNAASHYHLGGLILFGRDVEGMSLAAIKTKVDSWQKGLKTKLFIGIDEEGGLVSRLTFAGLADFASPQDLYNAGGMEAVESDVVKKAAVLEQIGVNVNFAPVADVCEDKNSFIYARTLGKDAGLTASYIENVVKKYHETNISPTLKHFPGYGCNVDTHSLISVDTRSLNDFKEKDFLPFKSGINAGAEFVMINHNIIKEIDDSAPASLSHMVHKILAEELGFSGIAITDDLSMAAIAEYYRGEYPAEVQAVLAGNNMLIVSDFASAFTSLKNAVENKIISEEYLDYQLMPVIALKVKKGLAN